MGGGGAEQDLNLVPSHFRAQAADHSPELHVQPRAHSLPPPYHMPLVGDMRLKVPKVPQHEALDCTATAGSSLAQDHRSQRLGMCSCPGTGTSTSFVSALRERMTAVIPGLVAVLYQIKEELASGRKREVSLRHLETRMCFLYTFY